MRRVINVKLDFTLAFLVIIEFSILYGIVMNVIIGNWSQVTIYVVLMILVVYLIWRRLRSE